jgi:hypothetical protein
VRQTTVKHKRLTITAVLGMWCSSARTADGLSRDQSPSIAMPSRLRDKKRI